MNNIFRIKKEERLFALITLIVIIAFNVLMITYHFDDFGKPKRILDALHQELSDFRFRPLHLPYPLEVEGVLHGVSPSHAPLLPLSFLATERLADRTHLPQLGNYHRGGDDDFFSTYSTLFFRRIFREVMQLKAIDSNVLTAMLFPLPTCCSSPLWMTISACRFSSCQ